MHSNVPTSNNGCATEDLREFKCWLRDTLRNGALWFNYNDPVEGALVRCRFVGGDITFSPKAAVLSNVPTVWMATTIMESWYGCES